MESAGKEKEQAMESLLELRGITCRFAGGILANRGVDLSVKRGEVHALLGENGAGKSTLMKVAYGLLQPSEGEIHWKGKARSFHSAAEAREAGIGMVHQHFMLIPTLLVWESLILGQEPQRGLFLDRQTARQRIRLLGERYGIAVDPDARVADLSVGEQQRVEILKALYREIDLLILDEPTAVLTPQEIEALFLSLRQMVKEGLTILFISHKLREIRALADRVSILRRGQKVDEGSIAEMDDARITQAMVGRIPQATLRKPRKEAPTRFLLQDLRYRDTTGRLRLDDLSFSIQRGEILGIAGVEGNGQH
jgi:simple sugar transport system ATP-binding protein